MSEARFVVKRLECDCPCSYWYVVDTTTGGDISARNLPKGWALALANAANAESRVKELEAELTRLKEQLKEAGERWKHEPCIQEVTRLREREKAARAEGMMDASWLIWEKVVESDRGIKVVKKCRDAIEAEAERLCPGVKLPWQRAAIRAEPSVKDAALSGEAKDGGEEKKG